MGDYYGQPPWISGSHSNSSHYSNYNNYRYPPAHQSQYYGSRYHPYSGNFAHQPAYYLNTNPGSSQQSPGPGHVSRKLLLQNSNHRKIEDIDAQIRNLEQKIESSIQSQNQQLCIKKETKNPTPAVPIKTESVKMERKTQNEKNNKPINIKVENAALISRENTLVVANNTCGKVKTEMPEIVKQENNVIHHENIPDVIIISDTIGETRKKNKKKFVPNRNVSQNYEYSESQWYQPNPWDYDQQCYFNNTGYFKNSWPKKSAKKAGYKKAQTLVIESCSSTNQNKGKYEKIWCAKRSNKIPKLLSDVRKRRWLKRYKKSQGRLKFYHKLLCTIYEFVIDEKRTKMIFDLRTRINRRIVKRCVACLLREQIFESEEIDDYIYGIMNAIEDNNTYILYSQFVGVNPNRKLLLVKEPPEHVYLITDEHIYAPSIIQNRPNFYLKHIFNPNYGRVSAENNYLNETLKIIKERYGDEDIGQINVNVKTEMSNENNIKIENENTASSCIQACPKDNIIVERNLFKVETNTVQAIKIKTDIPTNVIKIEKDCQEVIVIDDDDSIHGFSSDDDSVKFIGKSQIKRKEINIKHNNIQRSTNPYKNRHINVKKEADVIDTTDKITTLSTDLKGLLTTQILPEVKEQDSVEPSIKYEYKLNQFLQEFTARDEFTELRFLGYFDDREVKIIDDIINNLVICDSVNKSHELFGFDVFRDGRLKLEVKEIMHGSKLVKKTIIK